MRAEVAGDGVQLRLVDASGNYTSEVAAGVAAAAGRSLADSPSDEIWLGLRLRLGFGLANPNPNPSPNPSPSPSPNPAPSPYP